MGAKKLPLRMKNAGFECEVPGCTNEAVAAGLCANCYQVELYWGKKTPAQRRARMKQLELWESRMERMLSPRLRSVK